MILYRAGGTGRLAQGTLEHTIKAELFEFGKSDIKLEYGIDASKILTTNLLWVCLTPDSASEFSDVHPEDFKNFRVVANDNKGRMLIEHRKKKGKPCQR